MTEKSNTGVIVIACLLTAILAGFLGHLVFPTEKVTTVEKPVSNPADQAQIADLKTQVTNLQTELNKEKTNEAVVQTATTGRLDDAVKEYFAELNDNDKLLVCGGDVYSFADASQAKDIKSYSITEDKSNRRDTKTIVSFDIKTKFADTSDDHPCYRTDEVKVTFHSNTNKDTEIVVS